MGCLAITARIPEIIKAVVLGWTILFILLKVEVGKSRNIKRIHACGLSAGKGRIDENRCAVIVCSSRKDIFLPTFFRLE